MPKLSDNIGQTYGREFPAAFASRHGTEVIASPEALVGIELEIEGWQWDRRLPGFSFTDDGSLRNNGIEAVSTPIRLMHAPGLLRSFFATFPVTEANYSERCSIHVHMNVLDFTFEQLATLALLYQTLERVLFAWVGNDRDKSIFCVPWSQSGTNYRLVSNMMNEPHHAIRRWQKYTALNLAPVQTQGTVEFRHLHGTNDQALITNWLRVIGRLRAYAVANPLEKVKDQLLNMNTVSNYGQWLEDVFQQEAAMLRSEKLDTQLSLGVVDTKFMLIQPEPLSAKKFYTSLNWEEQQRNLAAVLEDPQAPVATFGWGGDTQSITAAPNPFMAPRAVAEPEPNPAPRVAPVDGRPLVGWHRGRGAQRRDFWSVNAEAKLNDGERAVIVRSNMDLNEAHEVSRTLTTQQSLQGDPRRRGRYMLVEIMTRPGTTNWRPGTVDDLDDNEEDTELN